MLPALKYFRRFGRFKTIALFQIIFTTVTIVVPFSADVTMFSALRFLTGVASVSSSVTMLILCKFRNYRVERSCCYTSVNMDSWWRHLMKTFSALLDLCAGNSPVSFDVFVDLRLMKPLRKQWRLRWFETPEPSLWRHSNDFSLSYNNNLWRIYRLTHWGLG